MRKKNDSLPPGEHKSAWITDARIVCGVYLIVGIGWIILSDQLLNILVGVNAQLSILQSYKGIFYVIVTTLLLYLLITKLVKHQNYLYSQLDKSQKIYWEVFTTSPEAQIIYHSQSFKVIKANEQARLVLNSTARGIEGLHLRDLLGQSVESGHFFDWLARANPATDDNYSFNLVRANGAKSQIAIAQHDLTQSQQSYGLLVLRDVSEVRRYIRNIEHAAKRLDIAREVSGLGCWEIDLNKSQVFCCLNVNNLLGLTTSPNTGIPIERFEEMPNTDIFCHIAKVLTSGEQQEVRLEHELLDHKRQTRQILIQASYHKTSGTDSIIGTVLDQTEQQQIEDKLRQQQHQWTNLVETLPEGVGIIRNNRFVYMNQAALSMLHAESLAEVSGHSILDFVQENDKSDVKERMANILNQEGQTEGFFHRHLHRIDGQPFEAEIAARIISYEGQAAIQIVIRDLTESLKSQEALASANRRLSSLSSKSLDMLERERKRIAGELHDDVGQSLTAIKLMTRWLARRLTDKALQDKTEDIQQVCANTLETVRNLSLMLRPAQLDSLGLPAAIEWQADKLFGDSLMQFSLDASQFREIEDKDIEIIAFRVLQESLTNIARHADANAVKVALQTEQESFHFTVVDNGKGFDVNQQRNSTGLVNMKERVELANGKIQISSLPCVGTEINVRLPIVKQQNVNTEQENGTE
tara:strand:- start:2506 stop:4593 length:2088 start_codon:yes stop_codon:yes gene_type:complete